eukprot:EG_transcript_16399
MAEALEQAMEEDMDAVDTEGMDFDPLKVFVRSFADNQQSIDTFEQRDAEYEALATLLRDLVQRTRRDVMVPLGPCAFVPGYLRHTNEVLVLLGDNWFALRSVAQTLGVVERRRAHVRAVVRSLEEALEALRIKVQLAHQMQAEQDPVAAQWSSSPRPPVPASATGDIAAPTAPASRLAPAPPAGHDPFSRHSVAAARHAMDALLAMEDAAGEAGAEADDHDVDDEAATAQSGQLEEDELQSILNKLNCLKEVSTPEPAARSALPSDPGASRPVVSSPGEIYDFLSRLTAGRAGPTASGLAADQVVAPQRSGGAGPPPAEETSPAAVESARTRKAVHWGPETAVPPPPPPAPPDRVVVPVRREGDGVAFTGLVQERQTA